MKTTLKRAAAKALIDVMSSFGKSLALAGSLAIAGNLLRVPIAVDASALTAFILIFLGFSVMIMANLLDKGGSK